MRKAIGAICMALALGACERTPLYSALTEQQANEVEAALLAAGIDASKQAAGKNGNWGVHVAKAEVPQAMSVLRAQGLPREPLQSMGEVFRKEDFVSSPLEERARYVHALSQELARTLMQIDGVVAARVHIALPERNMLQPENESASASVVIVESADGRVRERETDIKAIVTDGVEGLDDVNRVTVKFFRRGAGADGKAVVTAGAAPPASASVAGGAGTGLLAAALAAVGVLSAAAWQQLRRRRSSSGSDADGSL